MKRLFSLVFSIIISLAIISGYAETFTSLDDDIFPDDSLWGISQEDFLNSKDGNYIECKVGKKNV